MASVHDFQKLISQIVKLSPISSMLLFVKVCSKLNITSPVISFMGLFWRGKRSPKFYFLNINGDNLLSVNFLHLQMLMPGIASAHMVWAEGKNAIKRSERWHLRRWVEGPSHSLSHQGFLLLPFQHSHIYLAHGRFQAPTVLKQSGILRQHRAPLSVTHRGAGFKPRLNDEILLLRKVLVFITKFSKCTDF